MHSVREFLGRSRRGMVNRRRAGLAAMTLAMAMATVTPAGAESLRLADPSERGDGTLGPAAEQAISHGPLPFSKADVAAKAEANRAPAKSEAGDLGAAGAAAESRVPTVLLNFEGRTDANTTPPDTTGSIGTRRFIQLVNQKAGIYNRDTGKLIEKGPLSDLAAVGPGVNSFHPQIMWDAQTKRFYYAMDSVFSATDNRLSFGFSTGASPSNLTTDWCHYNTIMYGAKFPDYPRLGDSLYFLLIGVNVYSGTDFSGSDLIAIAKPRNGTTCPTKLRIRTDTNLVDSDGNQVFTPVPAQQVDNSETGYVAAIPGNLTTSASKLWFFDVTRNPDTHLPVFAAARGLSVSSYALPPDATQPLAPGETLGRKLDTLDGRLTQAVQALNPNRKKFSFWTQHTIANGSLSGVRWYEIDPEPATPVVSRYGTIRDTKSFLYNAAISPDRQRDGSTLAFGNSFLIEYNASGRISGLSPRIVSGSSFNGGALRFSPVQRGGGPYEDSSCPNDGDTCLWGEYSAASPDPRPPSSRPLTDRGIVWGTNEFSNPPVTGNSWDTQIFSLQP